MKTKIKSILIGALIGIVAFPVVAVGSSFTVSLIQGKTVEEAIQILAKQINLLTGRVEVIETKQEIQKQKTEIIETKQTEQEKTTQELQEKLAKEKVCNEYNRILAEIKDICGNRPYPGINGCIWYRKYLYFIYSDPTLVMIRVNEGNMTEVYWQKEAEKQLRKLNELKDLKTQYLNVAEGCGISLNGENQNSEEWIKEYACHYVIKFESNNTSEELQSNPDYLWIKGYCVE